MPRFYTSDLFRDYQALVCEAFGEPPREFLWAIGDTGTHLVWGDSRTCDVQTISRIWPALSWYWWDGRRLHRTAVPASIEDEIRRRKVNRAADHDTYRARLSA